MKNELMQLGFNKIPNGSLYQLGKTLIYLTKADIKMMNFNVENLNIDQSTFKNYFENFFILVEIEKDKNYILYKKDTKNIELGVFKRNKIGIPNWKFKFNIIPSIDQETFSIVAIENCRYQIKNTLDVEVLLDKESVLCILNDFALQMTNI